MYDPNWVDLSSRIGSALDYAREQSDRTPSRELSLVVTKLEEAQLWMGRVKTHD